MAIYYPKIYTPLTKLTQFLTIWLLFVPVFYTICRLKVYGKENLQKAKTPIIVMSNHLSYFDPPVVSTALNIPIAWMAKEELFSVPILNWLIILLAAFSVNREKIEKTTIKATKKIIEKNWSIGVFLEGTRSKNTGILGKPNLGVAYIASLNNTQILPVGVIGTNKPFGPFIVKIGVPFYPDKDLEKAKWQCAEKLTELTGFKLPES